MGPFSNSMYLKLPSRSTKYFSKLSKSTGCSITRFRDFPSISRDKSVKNNSSQVVVLIGKFFGNTNRESEDDVDAVISTVRVLLKFETIESVGCEDAVCASDLMILI